MPEDLPRPSGHSEGSLARVPLSGKAVALLPGVGCYWPGHSGPHSPEAAVKLTTVHALTVLPLLAAHGRGEHACEPGCATLLAGLRIPVMRIP